MTRSCYPCLLLLLFPSLLALGCDSGFNTVGTDPIYQLTADGTACTSTFPIDVASGWSLDRLHHNGFKDYGCHVVDAENGHPVRAGQQSLRFEVRDGDCNSNDGFDDCANDRSRHEITQTSDFASDGDEVWTAWSLYVPDASLRSKDEVVFLGQFQGANGVAPIMFEDLGTGYGVRQNDSSYEIIHHERLVANDQFRSQWTDVLLHLVWSSGSDGLIEIFINGALVDTLVGPNVTVGSDTVMHLGIYNAFISQCDCDFMPTQIVYFDEIRQGTTRSEVELVN